MAVQHIFTEENSSTFSYEHLIDAVSQRKVYRSKGSYAISDKNGADTLIDVEGVKLSDGINLTLIPIGEIEVGSTSGYSDTASLIADLYPVIRNV